MFEKTDKIKDNIKDEVWPYLLRLNERTSWNDESKDQLEKLKKFLKNKKKYISFVGHPNRYHLTRIGDSCLYDVPTFRKGVLTEFRGKRIRVVCVSSGRYDRLLMAGAVGVTPKNKIKIKEKISYVFPEIGDHKIAYLGRRYMVIEAKGKSPIELYQGSFNSIDVKSCDLILLDGKEGCPIATFNYEPEDKVTGKLVGWSFPETFSDLHTGIREMTKKNERFRTSVTN
jgi:hypothetical protein